MKAIHPWLLVGPLAVLLVLPACRSSRTNQQGKTPARAVQGKISPELKIQLTDLYIDAATKEAQEYYDDALNGYMAVLKLYPDHAAANYHVARLLHRNGTHENALPYAEKAVKLDPHNIFFHQLLARLYLYDNQHEKAMKTLENARKYFPDDTELISDLGDHYLRAREYEKALGLYDTLMNRRGADAELLRQKKEVYLYLNRQAEAVQTQLRLVEEYPAIKEYRYELYDLYLATDNPDAARVLLENLLKENPSDAFALFRLIEKYQESGENRKADSLAAIAFALPDIDLEEKVQYLLRLDTQPDDTLQQNRIDGLLEQLRLAHPDNSILSSYMGERMLRRGKLDDARIWFKRAAIQEENNLSLWMKLIQVDAELNRMDSLQADARMALDIYPNNVDILLYYAHACYAQKQYTETIETGVRLLKMTEGMRQAEVYLLLGDAYHYTQNYARSDESFAKSLEINPRSYTAMNNYAYFLSLRGERLEYALQLIEKAVNGQPMNPYFMDTYGWVLYKLGRLQDARTWITKSYEMAPSAEVAEHLGDVYLKLGDKINAQKFWKLAREEGTPNEALERKIKENQP
ncbi:MAG: tetratricopeptide repeat protein [Bacteroidetes bacterium]|nr:tetratricopeptide repeat protein [Bacteroidota bacterium]